MHAESFGFYQQCIDFIQNAHHANALYEHGFVINVVINLLRIRR